jgi:hypothetical protein
VGVTVRSLPFFAGYSVPDSPSGTYGENECGLINTKCGLIYTAPANAQPGDLFLAEISIGEETTSSYLTLPTGWVPLTLTNLKNHEGMVSTDGSLYVTRFLAASVYDTGSYTFRILTQIDTSELDGFLVSYRGATNTPANLVTYGHAATSDRTSDSTGKVTPTGQSTLANLFGVACLNDDEEEAVNWMRPLPRSHKSDDHPRNTAEQYFSFYARGCWCSHGGP